MKQGSSPEGLPHVNPMFAIIDMRGGELLCAIEAKDTEEAKRRAVSVASIFGWEVDTSELGVAVLDQGLSGLPTFLEGFFAQSGLFAPIPPGTKLQ
jgi:hypothetical protein